MAIRQKVNPFFDPKYNSIYKYSLEKETYSNTKDIRGVPPSIRVGAIIYKTQRVRRTLKAKEVKIKLKIETELLIGVKPLLVIISITLQIRRERD